MPLPGIAVEQYEELATKLGISKAWVYDLAAYDDEAADTLSIRQVIALSTITGILPCNILGIEHPISNNDKPVIPEELCDALTELFRQSGQQMDEFESEIGWKVRGILDDPATLYDTANWSCLVDLASAVNINPTALLPQPNTESEQVGDGDAEEAV
jgi:hypothetical protein